MTINVNLLCWSICMLIYLLISIRIDWVHSQSQCTSVDYVTTIAIPQCPGLYNIAVDTTTGIVYASCAQSVLAIFNETVTTFSECQYGDSHLFVDTESNHIYTWCQDISLSMIGDSQVVTLTSFTLFSVTNGIVYATDGNGNLVSIQGLNSTKLATSSQCQVRSVSADPATGVIYAGCSSGGTIKINGSTITTIATSTQCPYPFNLVVDSVRGFVYIACSSAGVISVSDSAVTTIATAAQCVYADTIYVNSETGIVYVGCGDGVIAITGSTVTHLITSAQCPFPADVSLNTLSGALYAACSGINGYSSQLISISGSSVTNLTKNIQCEQLIGVTANVVTGEVYASCLGALISISGSTVNTVFTAPQCYQAVGVAVNSATGVVYAACVTNNAVLSLVGSTISNLAYCSRPFDVSVNSATGVVYAACGEGVISINGSIVRTLTSQCSNAQRVEVDSGTGIVYAQCQEGLISINGSIITTLTTPSQCSSPQHISVNDATGIVYAVCGGIVISIKNSTVNTLPISSECGSASRVYVNSITGIVYVVCSSENVLLSIDGAVISTLTTSVQCPQPEFAYVNPATGIVYAACYQGSVIAITSNFLCFEGFYWSLGECIPCPSNSFRNSTIIIQRQLGCSSCYPGTSSAIVGAVDCAVCSSGSYSASSGASTCTLCPFGTYNSLTAQSSCATCPPGTFGGGPGLSSTSCSGLCEAGYLCPMGSISQTQIPCGAYSVYCPSGSGLALPVSAGYYSTGGVSQQTRTNQTRCDLGFYCTNGLKTLCSPGMYTNETGLSSCLSCSIGRYNYPTVQGQTRCYDCPPGQSNNGEGLISCFGCIPGQYQDTTSQACEDCALGRVSPGGTTTCHNCSAGSYTVSTGSVTCILCSPGTYTAQDGYSEGCISCPIGKYNFPATQGQNQCYDCPIGQSNSIKGSISCSGCLPGQFKNLTTGACENCPFGQISSGGTTSCNNCSAGEYTVYDGSVACIACSPGTYTPISSYPQSDCLPCPIGRYNYPATQGQTQCYDCPAGSSNSIEGSVACAGCSPGQAATGPLSQCEVCPRGSISVSAATNCTLCAAGYYTEGTNSVNCIPCPPGTITPTAGWSSSCFDCVAGRYSTSGASICGQCSPGYFSGNGSAVCSACARGTYAANNASLTCDNCVTGTYAAVVGSSECSQCPVGYVSAEASSSCLQCSGSTVPVDGASRCSVSPCVGGQQDASDGSGKCDLCPINTYSPGRGVVCQPCPPNSYAPAVGAFQCISCDSLVGVSCSTGAAVVESDYWGFLVVNSLAHSNIYPAATDQPSAITVGVNGTSIVGRIEIQTAPCPVGYCTGGGELSIAEFVDPNKILSETLLASHAAVQPILSSQLSAVGGSGCAPGRDSSRDNVMCGQCQSGLVEWNGSCVECSGTKASLVSVLLFGSIIYVIALHVLSQSSSSDVKILVYFVQSAIFQLGPFSDYLSWLGLFNFSPTQASGSTCVTPLSPYQSLALSALIPVGFATELLVILVIHYCVFRVPRRWKFRLRYLLTKCKSTCKSKTPVARQFVTWSDKVQTSVDLEFPWSSYCRTFISLFLFSYQQVTTACLRYAQCVNVAGQSVVYSVPGINCNSSVYQSYLGLVIFLLVADTCLSPVLITLFLYRHRFAIRKRDVGFQHAYGILYESYRSSAYFWTPVVLVRQVLLISLDIAFESEHGYKYLAFTYFNLLVVVLHLVTQPNMKVAENQIESVSHLLLIMISSIISIRLPPYPFSEQMFVFFLVVPFASILVILVALTRLSCKPCKRLATITGLESDQDHAETREQIKAIKATKIVSFSKQMVRSTALVTPASHITSDSFPQQQQKQLAMSQLLQSNNREESVEMIELPD